MFKNLFLGEVKKSCRLKTAIIFALIFVVGFIIIAVVLNVVGEVMTSGALTEDGAEIGVDINGEAALDKDALKVQYTKEDCESIIFANKAILAQYEKLKSEQGYKYYLSFGDTYDNIYDAKCQIAIAQYVLDNDLCGEPIEVYTSGSGAIKTILGFGDGAAFTSTMLVIMAELLILYAIVIGSGSMATEMRNGTLKLVLMSPIKRKDVVSAKLLSTLTILTVAYMAVFLVSVIFGYIAYGRSVSSALYVFNATSVFSATNELEMCLTFFNGYISVLFYGLCAFFVGLLTKKRALGIVVPYAITLVSSLVNMSGLGRFWPSNAISFSGFFASSGSMLVGSNFYINLGMTIFYFAAMVLASYWIFEKRDIA